MTQVHIPHYMLDNILLTQRIPGRPENQPQYLALTKDHRYLHIVSHQNVLASLVLPPLSPLLPGHTVQLDIRFTYCPAPKRMHVLLLIGQHFAVITQRNRQLQIAHTAQDIRGFAVLPDSDAEPGQVAVRLTTAGGLHIEKPLREFTAPSAWDDYGAGDRVDAGRASDEIGPIVRIMQESLRKTRSELAAQRLCNAQLAGQLADGQRFGPASLRGDGLDEKQMMAQYGDVWTRACGEQLVVAVPVFNCTFKRKRTLLNVRLVLHAPQAPTPLYTYQLFTCRLDASVQPDLQALLDSGELDADEDGPLRMSFEHEWQKTNHLLPETAAIIVATMTMPTFADIAGVPLKCIVVYDIEMTDAHGRPQTHPVQLSCGDVRIGADILLSGRTPTFAPTCRFKDLLTVTATSVMWPMRLRCATAARAMAVYDLLATRGFVHVPMADGDAAEQTLLDADAMDVDRYIDDIVGSAPPNGGSAVVARRLRFADMFYCGRDYFDGVLLRRHRKTAAEHELKVYGRSARQLDNFVQCLRGLVGPHSVSRLPLSRDPVADLQRAVADEMDLLQTFDYDGQTVDGFVRERTRRELFTDLSAVQVHMMREREGD